MILIIAHPNSMAVSKEKRRIGSELRESVKKELPIPTTFVQEPCGDRRCQLDGGGHRPLLVDDHDQVEDGEAYELALQTFYCEEDEYSPLHCQFFPTNRKGRERMENQGLQWRKGRWSVQEIRLLRRNVRAFMRDHAVTDISSVIQERDRSKHATLYKYIAKGIQRPLFSIYRKALLVFNVHNYVGRWTAEMDQELHRLRAVHGNRWEEIGRHMGLSGRAVYDRFRMVSNRKNQGPWSQAEEQKLCSVMAEIQKEGGGERDDLPGDVRWEDVAAKVGSRNAIQCHHKWILQLSWKQAGQQTVKWNVQDDLKLIYTLSSLEVEDEEQVCWDGLCDGWPAAHNASCLRLRWASLRRDVPHYQVQTFHENLDYLLTVKVPALEGSNCSTT